MVQDCKWDYTYRDVEYYGDELRYVFLNIEDLTMDRSFSVILWAKQEKFDSSALTLDRGTDYIPKYFLLRFLDTKIREEFEKEKDLKYKKTSMRLIDNAMSYIKKIDCSKAA